MPRRDPACATCREKCRRCDRARPVCKRCATRGLECKGYPETFQFKPVTVAVTAAEPRRVAARYTTRKRKLAALQPYEEEFPTTDVHRGLVSESWDGEVGLWSSSSIDYSPSPPPPPPPQQGNQMAELDDLLLQTQTQRLLAYYDTVICPHQIVLTGRGKRENPYRSYVLPLAYEQLGLLYAVLGLAACHDGLRNGKEDLREVADEYRLRCISCLRKSLENGISPQSHENERDGLFATIQLLLLHDICESGISTHGAHITGAMSICSQLRLSTTLTDKDERAIFFLGNLAWLDVIRSLSDATRLCFSPGLRQTIAALSTPKFEQVNGCPRDLFLMVGDALEYAKSRAMGRIDRRQYKQLLLGVQLRMYAWQLSDWAFPDGGDGDDGDNRNCWAAVGESFRHAFILYTSRLLAPERPAEAAVIQDSVTAILDAVSGIHTGPIELVILPLFIAGADCISRHSRHYVILRLDGISAISGFSTELPKMLLRQVWDARSRQAKRECENILWTAFSDYLII
ncbi:fungal-specific transcription factor domain-containing protein [Aspergillus pseudodeflectus]|uniref:Fungal-specific transcription factor domain-containing protein n=1 Tax=Aspergillus pseudodeflectus TaxID=176178 RepID=A0ABR4K2N7_9EURO